MSDSAGHGALMDNIYRQQRHIYDLTREYFLLGRDRLIKDLSPPPAGTVLEVACGTGRNLVHVAQQNSDARLFGFDISEAMLETARGSLARKGLGDRVTLAQGDACDFAPDAMFDQPKFDRIFMSYCLSMIPDWQGALREAASHLAPGGQLMVVDFGDQTDLPAWFRRGLQAWLTKFHVAPRLELEPVMLQAAEAIGGEAYVVSLKKDYCRYGVLSAPV